MPGSLPLPRPDPARPEPPAPSRSCSPPAAVGGAWQTSAITSTYRPRIALLCGGADPALDGVADYTHRLADALSGAGADAEVLAVRGLRGARVDLRRLAPDLVHVQFAPSAYRFSPRAGLLPAVSRRPTVTTLHEYGWWRWPAWVPAAAWRPVERAGWWDREAGRLTVSAGEVLATNGRHAAAVGDRLGRPATVIPIGSNVPVARVDRDAARARLRDRLGLPPDAPVLAFFGFVHPVKGVRYLLEALAALRAGDHRTLGLVVVGGFTSLALPPAQAEAVAAELRAHAAALGVDRVTWFTGYRPAAEASALLAGADLAVLPFTAGVTAKSGSLLTAFSHRLPVVATAPPEPDPDLRDGAELVSVPVVRDATALADGIRRVLADPGLAARLAARGEQVATDRSWPSIARAHLAVYRRVLR